MTLQVGATAGPCTSNGNRVTGNATVADFADVDGGVPTLATVSGHKWCGTHARHDKPGKKYALVVTVDMLTFPVGGGYGVEVNMAVQVDTCVERVRHNPVLSLIGFINK